MKRFLIFLLLGPFLGFTVFIIRDIAGGMIFGGPWVSFLACPSPTFLGFPVVLMWGADWWLSDKISMPVKVVTSACVGYVAIIALLLMAATRHLTLHECLTFGIVGAFRRRFVLGSPVGLIKRPPTDWPLKYVWNSSGPKAARCWSPLTVRITFLFFRHEFTG
jgi:hypothetical protein